MDGVGAEEQQPPAAPECEGRKDTSLSTKNSVGDADEGSGCGTGSSAQSACQITTSKEEGEDTLAREDGISHNRSGMCTGKAAGGVPGDDCKQDVCGPATRQSFKCASANAATRQSYKVSSVLKPGNKGRKTLLGNLDILPRVRKKSRTLYSAEQLKELEKMFQEDHYPDNEKRREIASVVGVTPQRIMIWFQNRRAKWRKVEKWKMRNSNKCPTSSSLSMPFGSDGYGAPPPPAVAHDATAMLSADTAAGSYSSQLTGHPAPLASSSAPSVAEMVAPCEAAQATALAEHGFSSSSSRVERCPAFPSPPPIRRASLPHSLSFNPHSHIVPLMLDAPSSECSLARQPNGTREAFTYSIQNQGLSSPVSCNYPGQLEPSDNLEMPYCQYSSQSGSYQLPQYSQQHQLSQVHPLPSHLDSNALSSIQLSPTTPTESHTAFLNLPDSSGVVTYGAAGATQGYAQTQAAGELLVQQPCGTSADITAHQAVPWNDFYMQEALFPHQLCSRMPFASTAGHYFTEHNSYTQAPCLHSSPYFLQVPNGATLGCMPHPGKQKGVTPEEQNSYQKHQTEAELTSLAEREETESSSEEGEAAVDLKEEPHD